MKDYDNKVKLEYFKMMKIDFIPEESNSTSFKINSYMKNFFPYNTFFII